MAEDFKKLADSLAYEAACEIVPMGKYLDRMSRYGQDTVRNPQDEAIQKREEVRRTLEPFFLKALQHDALPDDARVSAFGPRERIGFHSVL